MSKAKATWFCLTGALILWAAPALVEKAVGSGSVTPAGLPEQVKVAELIRRATVPTKNGASEQEARCKLVEIGEPVVPAIVEWLQREETNGGLNDGWNSYVDMVEVLSLISSPKVCKFLAPDRAHSTVLSSEAWRANLLKRVEIWQSENRFVRLSEALGGARFNLKWAIFKLGVLGDARAIEPLGRIATEDKELDIRETVKDALAHLRDPNIPMRYIVHSPSAEFVLTAAESYHVGEPVKVRCRITGGTYGSPDLVEFSRPNWHFLPWGLAGPDPNWSPPVGLTIHRRQDRAYNEVHSSRQLHGRKGLITGGHPGPYQGYVSVAELGRAGTFTLKPGESRVYEFADLRQAFKMVEPGDYRIHVSSDGYVLSDFLTINILPAGATN